MNEIKVITWNIGGISSNKEILLDFVDNSKVDIYCLQETKTFCDTVNKIKLVGYYSYANESERTNHRGSAIYYKTEPINKSNQAPLSMLSNGRFLILEYSDFYLLNIYLPNSGNKLQRLEDKVISMQWLISLSQRLNEIKPIIMLGDFNVGKFYKDSVKRTLHKASAGFSRNEQDLFKKLLSLGFVDVLAHQYPSEENLVSYIDNKSGNPNIANGYRLDYILVSERLADRIISADVHTDRQRHGSRHLPVELVLRI